MTYIPNRAPLASPAFTGSPTAPTPSAADNDTSIATTAFVQGELGAYLTTSAAASTYAPLASPVLTGNPTAPTPATSDNDTSVATTAFVRSAITTYGQSAPVVTAVKTGAYTAAAGEVVLCDPTSAGFTVSLPSTHTASQQIVVKNVSASANTITVDPTDADTVDGAATYLINDARGGVTVISDGTNWHVL